MVGTIVRNMGSMALKRYSAGNNNWAGGMNENLLKMSLTISSTVKSRKTALPDTAMDGDQYIEPGSGRLCIWAEDVPQDLGGELTGWFAASPKTGLIFYVQDDAEYVIFAEGGGWTPLISFDKPYTPVPRTLAFFAPGPIKAGSDVFQYVSGFPLSIKAGAAGSGASLIVAPSAGITFQIFHSNIVVGSIQFSGGSNDGAVNFPQNVAFNNALPAERRYYQSQMLSIKAPADLKGAQGLSFTLTADIWDQD